MTGERFTKTIQRLADMHDHGVAFMYARIFLPGIKPAEVDKIVSMRAEFIGEHLAALRFVDHSEELGDGN
jgi:hypothetical protein